MLGERTIRLKSTPVIKVTPYTEKQMKEAVSGAELSMKEQYQYIRHSYTYVYTIKLGLWLKEVMLSLKECMYASQCHTMTNNRTLN